MPSYPLFSGFVVLFNCFLNGLANLYVHNNLDIFADCNERRVDDPGSNGNNSTRSRSVVRQVLFDTIFLLECSVMIGFGIHSFPMLPQGDDHRAFRLHVAATLLAVYLASFLVKAFYYLLCHPWATLISKKRDNVEEQMVLLSRTISLNRSFSTKSKNVSLPSDGNDISQL